jgi:hypothetical protein
VRADPETTHAAVDGRPVDAELARGLRDVAMAAGEHRAQSGGLAVERRGAAHSGNLYQSRHYSQYVSLQLKARMEGLPTPVWGIQPVHHKA